MLEMTQMTAMVGFGLMIAGVVELINRLRGRDYWAAATIVSAGLVGAILGLFDPFGLNSNWAFGMAMGLSMSGLITTLGSIGNKSSATPSEVVK